MEIQRGVRQGCILSPLLFDLHPEEVFVKALSNCKEGTKINGEILNNIRYTDHNYIIAETQESLQNLLSKRANDSIQLKNFKKFLYHGYKNKKHANEAGK